MNETAKEKLHRRINKLLRLAGNNPSIEEATLAATHAQRLMDEHNLTEAMLELEGNQTEPDEEIINFAKHGAPLDTDLARGKSYKYVLTSILSKLHGVLIYRDQGQLHIVGRPTDVETVRYIFSYLVNQIEALVAKHGRGMGATWRNNYCTGAANGVGQRLKEAHNAWHKEQRVRASDSAQALVRLDQALARVERKHQEARDFAYSTLKLRTETTGKAKWSPGARALGAQHGREISLGGKAAIGQGGRKQLKGQ